MSAPAVSRSRRGALLALGLICAAPLAAQQRPRERALSLVAALRLARDNSPELRGARAAADAAAGLVRQAGAFANPVLSYSRERTSRGAQTNAQNITQLEQQLELGGQRGARREAAQRRRDVAEAQVQLVRHRLDIDVVRTFALAIAATERARLADQFTAVFTEAQRVSDQRFAAGDISGYAARRLRLEAARFAALRATAALEHRSARTALAALLGRAVSSPDSLVLADDLPALTSVLSRAVPSTDLPLDSLTKIAIASRPDIRAARFDATATEAEARLAARSRLPVPVLSAGQKNERVADGQSSLTGFTGYVAGFAIPLPLFDRRAGAIAAAQADVRVSTAAVDAAVRRATREVADAVDALRSVDAQRIALSPYMGDEARRALTAVQVSYTEGEISLVEWLDAVRAYQDAQSTYTTLLAEVVVRHAALAQVLGISLLTDSPQDGSDAAAAPSRKD